MLYAPSGPPGRSTAAFAAIPRDTRSARSRVDVDRSWSTSIRPTSPPRTSPDARAKGRYHGRQRRGAAGARAAFRAGRAKQFGRALWDIGDYMLGETRERFETETDPDGRPWKITWRKRRRPSAKILTNTGRLQRSFRRRVNQSAGTVRGLIRPAVCLRPAPRREESSHPASSDPARLDGRGEEADPAPARHRQERKWRPGQADRVAGAPDPRRRRRATNARCSTSSIGAH